MIKKKNGIRITEADSGDLMRMVRYVRDIVFVREQNVPPEREYDEYESTSVHYLALWGDDPVGCIRYRMVKNRAKIERLAVLDQHRNRGIGSLLMEHAQREAAIEGAVGFILNSQLAAISFYERFGYRARGPIFKDAGIDHREMLKEVM